MRAAVLDRMLTLLLRGGMQNQWVVVHNRHCQDTSQSMNDRTMRSVAKAIARRDVFRMCKFYTVNKTNGDRAKRLEKKMRYLRQCEMAIHVRDGQWKIIKQLLPKTL